MNRAPAARFFDIGSRCLAGTAAAALLLLSGCASVRPPEAVERVWPEPPLTPRIKFAGTLADDDLGRGALGTIKTSLLGDTSRPRLSQPMGIAVSPDAHRVYVTDYSAGSVFVFDVESRRVSELGDDRNGWRSPLGVAVDASENIYVVDSGAARIVVFDRARKLVHTIVDRSFERPTGIAVDSARGRIYVADSAHRDSPNHVIRVFDIAGRYVGAFGGKGSAEGQFFFPTYLAVGDDGRIYVADTMNSRVEVFDPDGHWLRTIGRRGDAPGMFDKPKGVALDAFGNVYVVDSSWSNVQIFNSRGQVLLFFAARGHLPGLLFNPTGIAIDRDNRIYVADAFNGRVGIYQLINTKAEDSNLVTERK